MDMPAYNPPQSLHHHLTPICHQHQSDRSSELYGDADWAPPPTQLTDE